MKRLLGVKIVLLVLLVLALGMPSALTAADYPTKPVTLLIPMAPGGSSDVLGRAFASVATKYLEQPVVATNKSGASGMIGGQAGAKAPPDGYTLTVVSTSVRCAVAWEKANGRTPAFTEDDFIGIVTLNISPAVIIVPYESPWKKLEDLIADARSKPGYYAYCSGGLYSSSHMPLEIFSRALGLKFRHVPSTGGGPCINAVVGKHVDFASQYPSSSIALIQGKKMRALAIQSDKRLESLPDVPTVKELGIDAEFYQNTSIAVPRNTPLPVIQKLREVAKKVVEDKTYTGVVENMGDEVYYLIGDAMVNRWKKEAESINKVMEAIVKETAKK
jgi:tripartite-type tricarboxylate transporter receptor subunit TctC